MKKINLLFFLLFFLNSFSQIIEEKREGDFVVKNYLNKDLEIIKIEKHKENSLYESVEYLPGGKIKNGNFFHKLFGHGRYVNGRLEEGEILYLFNKSEFNTSWYIDEKNKIFVPQDKIKTKYGKNNQPSITYESSNGNWLNFQNYDEKKIVKNIVECFYVKLKISNYRMIGSFQIKKGLFEYGKGKLYEKNDDLNNLVAVLNFNENGVMDGEQLYFKIINFGYTNSFNRDDRKILHTAIYKNGNPLKYNKRILSDKSYETQTYIDSITFNKDDLKNSTFLYDNSIVNHPQPILVFNPFSGFIQLTDHYYYKNEEIKSTDNTTPENANLKSLKHTRNTYITNNLKKIVFKRSKDGDKLSDGTLLKNEDSFFDWDSRSSQDTKPDFDSNERKITFNGKPKVFYLKEQNFIDRIIKNDYSFVPYAFNWQKPGIKNSNEISSIELLYWYEFMLRGESKMHQTYFSKELGSIGNEAVFNGYGNSSRYDFVSYLKKDLDNNILVDEIEYNEEYKNDFKESESIKINGELYIGKEHLGGIIFYLDDNKKTGMIVSKNDLGRYNLKEAKEKCKNYIVNEGWKLPSVAELELIYLNLKSKGIIQFVEDYYWSSDEGRNVYFGNAVDFTDGQRTFGDLGVDGDFVVRAIKNF